MPAPVVAHTDHRAIESIQSGESGSSAVPLVVVRHRSAAAFFDRQSGLCAVQRLDLTLLIGAQDDRMFWRIKVETHDSVPVSPRTGHHC